MKLQKNNIWHINKNWCEIKWDLSLLPLLLVLARWLVLMLSTMFQICKMQRWHDSANLSPLVHLMMKCVESFDEHQRPRLCWSSVSERPASYYKEVLCQSPRCPQNPPQCPWCLILDAWEGHHPFHFTNFTKHA